MFVWLVLEDVKQMQKNYKNRNEICEKIFLVLKETQAHPFVSAKKIPCLRQHKQAVTLHWMTELWDSCSYWNHRNAAPEGSITFCRNRREQGYMMSRQEKNKPWAHFSNFPLFQSITHKRMPILSAAALWIFFFTSMFIKPNIVSYPPQSIFHCLLLPQTSSASHKIPVFSGSSLCFIESISLLCSLLA